MRLGRLESCALAGLESVEDKATSSEVPSPYLPDAIFNAALTEAQSCDPTLSAYDQTLISALYKDALWLIQAYGHSVASSTPHLLVNTNHALTLQSNASELLQIATLDDYDREELIKASSLMQAMGIPSFVITEHPEDSIMVRWGFHQRRLLENVPQTQGCPAMRLPSTIDASKTMAGYFFDRYVETFAIRNIAQATSTAIGQIAIMH